MGEIAQRDFWFPPVTIPAGCGQVRKPVQLPGLSRHGQAAHAPEAI